ncbi:MAG: NRDE family protein [Betaproteobacteria bacterium]|nr:NRDE family protein [Betaproteobacteria bacterium]
MCLIAFALGVDPKRPLLLASNRDEYFDRPTLPMQRWISPRGRLLISGRDARAGGTWLGLSEHGRVAWLTNVREPQAQEAARSRGELTLDWLEGDQSAADFMAALDPLAHQGFNLVLGDLDQQRWHWVSNRCPTPQGLIAHIQQRSLAPGVYALSNAFLDTAWPKTIKLREQLARTLEPPLEPDLLRERLWSALADAETAPTEQLPRTGVSPEVERALSAVRVRFADGRYGTRSSTLMLIERGTAGRWQADIEERSWDPQSLGHSRREVLLGPRQYTESAPRP